MKNVMSFALCLVVIGVLGCAQEPADTVSKPSVDGTPYLLTAEPENPSDIISARETAQQGDDVLVVGRIGGGRNPWIEDRAAFTIVDGSLKACSDIHGDSCKTPWDYCCETPKLASSSALVKVVDKNGELVKADARELLGVQELSTVVVQGKAQRDDEGNLTVLANKVYVRK